MNEEQIRQAEPELQNKFLDRFITGYIAFITTFLVLSLNLDVKLNHLNLIVSLFFLSLPSLAFILVIDYRIRVMQKRRKSILRGLALLLGFSFSTTGLIIFLSNYSMLASVIFALSIIFWVFAVDIVTFRGYNKKSEI